MNDPPITEWIRRAEELDAQSEEALWAHYFSRVVRLARTRMFALQASVYDEEDAAVSAMNSLFKGIRNCRFPDLHDRHNLWRLLILITRRKIRAQWRRESVRGQPVSQADAELTLAELLTKQPTPEFVTDMMDETDHLIEQLPDESLKRVAVLRMDGLSTDEIAEQFNWTARTVRRKLERIRDLWEIPEDF